MNNSFFTLCSQQSDNKNDIYQCCLQTCQAHSKAPHMCFSMCAQIFPLIKDRCAFEQECWRDGFYNKKCLEAKAPIIRDCCMERCQRSSRRRRFTNDELDCDRYCSDYNIR
jgi:hypothetical protein